jgi:Mg2+/citrate symporter
MPTPITLFLPWIAGAIAGWLSSARLPQWVNALIIAVLFAASVVLVALTGAQMTADPSTNITIIIGYCAAIFGLLKPCIDFLARNTPSPLAFLERVMPLMAQGTTSHAVTPVTLRASTLQPGQNYTARVTSTTATTEPIPPLPPDGPKAS